MSQYTEILWVIAPIESNPVLGRVAVKVMGNTADTALFEEFLFSSDGNEPATFVGTRCEVTKEQAHWWLKLLLPGATKPPDYPSVGNHDGRDIADIAQYRADANFFVGISDRIDNGRVKQRKDMRVIDSHFTLVTDVTDMNEIIAQLGLVEIKKASWV